MAAVNEIDPLDLELESLSDQNRKNWEIFTRSHAEELKTSPWEAPHMRVIQKMFILSAHLCEADKVTTEDALSTILKALELKPHVELNGLFPDWSPLTSIEQVSADLEFHKSDGLGMQIYDHLNQKVDPAISQRMAKIAFARS